MRNISTAATILTLLANGIAALPTDVNTTIEASSIAGQATSDSYPPAGSKYA